MPPELLCQWDDVTRLMRAADSVMFANRTCPERPATSAVFWWLSDPLWAEAGNERRVVHDARQTLVRLHAALPEDTRFHRENGYGADAVVSTILRYGLLMDPSDNNQGVRNSAAGHLAKRIWWPSEHMQREWPLVQLPEDQIGMLRRARSILLATAVNTTAAHQSHIAASDSAFLMLSTSVNDLRQIDKRPARATGTVVLRGSISAVPAMLSLEILGLSVTGTDARYRKAVNPPATLTCGQSEFLGEHLIQGTAGAKDCTRNEWFSFH